jgi:hypothetical protein
LLQVFRLCPKSIGHLVGAAKKIPKVTQWCAFKHAVTVCGQLYWTKNLPGGLCDKSENLEKYFIKTVTNRAI